MRHLNLFVLAFILILCFNYGTGKPKRKSDTYKKWFNKVVKHCKPGSNFRDPNNRPCKCKRPGIKICKPNKSKLPKSPKSPKSPKTDKLIKEVITNQKCSDGPIPRSWYEDCNVCFCPREFKADDVASPICTVMQCGKVHIPQVLKAKRDANKWILQYNEIESWAETCNPGEQRKHPIGCGNICDCVESGLASCKFIPCGLKKKMSKKARTSRPAKKAIKAFAKTCKVGEKKIFKHATNCSFCTCIVSGVVASCKPCKKKHSSP